MSNDYTLPKSLRAAEIGLTVFSMVGALIMGFGYWSGYWAYLMANICGIILFSYTRWWASLARNLFFLVTTLIGLWNNVL